MTDRRPVEESGSRPIPHGAEILYEAAARPEPRRPSQRSAADVMREAAGEPLRWEHLRKGPEPAKLVTLHTRLEELSRLNSDISAESNVASATAGGLILLFAAALIMMLFHIFPQSLPAVIAPLLLSGAILLFALPRTITLAEAGVEWKFRNSYLEAWNRLRGGILPVLIADEQLFEASASTKKRAPALAAHDLENELTRHLRDCARDFDRLCSIAEGQQQRGLGARLSGAKLPSGLRLLLIAVGAYAGTFLLTGWLGFLPLLLLTAPAAAALALRNFRDKARTAALADYFLGEPVASPLSGWSCRLKPNTELRHRTRQLPHELPGNSAAFEQQVHQHADKRERE